MSAVTLLRWEIALDEWAVGTGKVRVVDDVEEPVLEARPTVTSLVGDLRDHLRRKGLHERLLGGDAVRHDGARDDAEPRRRMPSAIAVHAVVPLDWDVEEFAPKRTVVDRDSGAARHLLLRTDPFRYGGRVALLASTWSDLDAAAKEALAGWVPQVGKGAGTGRGRAKVETLQTLRLDLEKDADWDRWVENSFDELFQTAGADRGWRAVTLQPERRTGAVHDRLRSGVPLVIIDGLQLYPEPEAVEDAEGKTRRNHLATGKRPGERPRLDGESVKGVLRSRAEHLLETCGLSVCRGDDPGNACGTCLACHLFGSPHAAGHLLVLPAPLGKKATKQVFSHNSTDHVVGHVLHLYTEERWFGGLTLRFEQDSERTVSEDGLALLAQVLLDLHEGYVGLGHGSTAHGTVQITDPGLVTWLQSQARVGDSSATAGA